MEGWFNKYLESRVTLAGVNSSFRNSSVFMQYAVDELHGQAFLEVDVLWDHLFRHVRRFVTSNPLPSYIRSVVVAFRCGHTTVNRILAITAVSGHSCNNCVAPEARSSGANANTGTPSVSTW